ncbi:E3 ubiquitin-protein ligase ZNF598 isoform X1 [Leptinotarsa decemlineata]|uniref:E3 ubiquitin-protein ligase ZNF598 isoform X1 n=1 Tax=Leptinotarsa decemlineata TaxID=7539 RepID=UPI003D308B8F
MSAAEAVNSSDNENLCVVCFKNVEIYSVGVCDHAVCFECSTRMRVLCEQNECPICRQELPKVIFTKVVEPFASLFPRFERSNLQDRKIGIYFCTSDIQKEYQKILEHRCHICEDKERKWPFKTFQQLKDHMRREHELFYCDICATNLKIFSFEKRCYTRQELGHHRRKGDPDNTSHRGHPLCEFCDTRFMDSEELFRHLRRNHLYCHFCDAEGKHQFYNIMEDLVRHFRHEHFLCEEGECKTMPLTAVFRTDIDCKAHKAMEHSKFMSRSANKQARTLELEFTLAPRPRSDNMRTRKYNDRRDRDDDLPLEDYNVEPGGSGGGGDERGRIFVNPLTSQDFPALGGASSNIVHTRPTTSVNFTSKMNSNFSSEDFPSLGTVKNSPAVTITTNSSSAKSSRAPEVTITRTVRGQQGLIKSKDNFPALSGPSSSSGSSTVRLSVNSSQDSNSPKVSIQVNHRPNGGVTTHITTSASSSTQQRPPEAFPALGKSGKVAQPQWVQVKSKKQEQKNLKVAPNPQLPPNSLDQFPTLSKKNSSGSMPSSSNWVNLNSVNNSISKKKISSYSKNSVGCSELKGNGLGNDKNTESKQSIPKAKLQTVEKKLVDLRITENGDSKNKNKKKKAKSNYGESSKVSSSNKVDHQSDSKFCSTGNGDTTNNGESDSKNGLVKKRSELKIGTLTNTGDASIISNDFPSLGDTKPPPGFSMKPPPGLTACSFPSLGASNDLTFTSSSGQSYSIKPCNDYSQPNNFQLRNQNLIKRFMAVLNNDAIKEFKTYSDLFRNGCYPTIKYYDHCKDVLGSYFDEIFPELLVLLPDIAKQQELYKVYDGKNKKNLIVCETCKQIIYKRELADHYNFHILDNQFPSLGKIEQMNNAWKK